MAQRLQFLLILIIIVSCAAKVNKPEGPLFSAQENQSKPLDLKTVFDTNYLGVNEPLELEKTKNEFAPFLETLNNSNLSRAIQKHCVTPATENATPPLFCETLQNSYNVKNPKTPRERTSLRVHQIRKHFKNGDINVIKDIPIMPLIGSLKTLNKNDLITGSEKILESAECLPSTTYLGTGSILENHLPEEKVFEVLFKVFEKTMTCSEDEYADRSAYRYSLLKIVKGDCAAAIPALDKITTRNNVPYLHSRAHYWKKKCQDKENIARDKASVYLSFPLTYHGLTSYLETEGSLYDAVVKNPEPLVITRVKEDPKLNALTIYAEYFISENQLEVSRRILKRIVFEYPVQNTPELGLYISYLMYRTHMGLDSFKVLAQILSQNSKMKTLTTMKLFYPAWYKDLVIEKAKNKNLDPALILALIRQESAFTAHARSPAGAVGLMQLLPSSARAFDRSANRRNLTNEEKNVTIGVQYVARLLEQFDNNVSMALASYNAGRLHVVDWKKRYPTENELLFLDLIPYRETREYVASILRNWYWYQTLYGSLEAPVVSQKE